MKMVIFDATVTSQFLMNGNVIERGGREIRVGMVLSRDDVTREITFTYLDPTTDNIREASIPYDTDVLLGTEIDVSDHLFD